MAYTKRQVVTVLSILYLLILTAIASYTLHTIRFYSLPIPTILSALTVALPAVTGLSIESVTEFRRRPSLISAFTSASKSRSERNKHVTITVFILLILETVLVTLSGTYLTPTSNLACGLNEQWGSLFSRKNENAIRRIQNGLECCGLHSVVDKAWPFPSDKKGIKVDTCAKRFERDASCFEGWRAMEQKAAGLMLLVVVLVFVWKILIVTDPLERPTWVHRVLRIPAQEDDAEHGGEGRRALEYPEVRDRFVDDPSAEADDLVASVPTVRSSDGRDRPLSPALASRVQPSGLMDRE